MLSFKLKARQRDEGPPLALLPAASHSYFINSMY
jgi:hypothetical protein